MFTFTHGVSHTLDAPPHLVARRRCAVWASVTADSRELTFHSSLSRESDALCCLFNIRAILQEASAARANLPILAACNIYFYEIEILNKGMKGRADSERVADGYFANT